MLLLKCVGAHFDDRWDLRIDVVVCKMEACSEGALVQQRVLVKLDLAAGIALVQAHGAVGKVDHFPQDQLWSFTENKKKTKLTEITLHRTNQVDTIENKNYVCSRRAIIKHKQKQTHANKEQAMTVNPHYL